MKEKSIKEKITIEDVKKFNSSLPEFIELENTRDQKAEIISKIDPKIKIKIGNRTYTPNEVSKIIKTFEKIEKGINLNWNNLEKALYIYIELIKKIEYMGRDISSNKKEENGKLSAIISQNAYSSDFSTIYKEAMDRLKIPCNKLIGNNDHSWNEIEINNKYYPVDLAKDAAGNKINKAKGEIRIQNFTTDKKFYQRPEHEIDIKTKERTIKSNSLERSEIEKSLKVITSINLSKEIKINPKIELKSKELLGVFKDNIVTNEEVNEKNNIKISLKDDNFKELKEDLAEIGRHYPNILRNIEFENTTNMAINMQELVDNVYTIRKIVRQADEEQEPVSITISSKFAEDFDLDFSNAPQITYNDSTPIDGDIKQKITLKNLSENAIILPNLKEKISRNIDELEIDGFNLANLDIRDTNIEKISIKSLLTKNIDSIDGIMEIPAVEIESISDTEFNNYYNRIFSRNSDIHDLTIKNQNFHGRKILEDLSINPNLARLRITNSKVNDLDGLELFNGRLGLLGLWNNDLTINDLERLNNFRRNNTYLEMYVNKNHNIKTAIQNAPEISDESYKFMSKWFYLNGMIENKENKKDTVDRLLWNSFDIPYYIKDAKIIREMLKITENPMMLENDDEIDTIDFNENHLAEGTLLLTIHQIERLLLSGKKVPQNIRINIHDVSELSGEKARTLYRDLQNKGMNLSGVQIFDENIDNVSTQIQPYSLSEYIYIRDTLDIIVSGIDRAEPDIDKFATIYQRLMDSIVYDTLAVKHNSSIESIYYAKKMNTSRNLLEGLEEGKCVCAGYADILRNALSLVGVESRMNAGRTKANDLNTGHAWNQVRIDDGTGNEKWYYTDLTWDTGNDNNKYTLLGKSNFIHQGHELTKTKNIEDVEMNDYDRNLLREAFERAKNRSFDFKQIDNIINIPEDPKMQVEILDKDRIYKEYQHRKKDMYAKYYGDKEYQKEYKERNKRYRENEVEKTKNGIKYRTIEDYPEKEADEAFLYLDKYKECLERMTKYEAGDISVYQGTPEQIQEKIEADKEYVETRNHTFNQNKNTRKDLATLGKYGEVVPYIPKQQGVLKNIGRTLLNAGIFTRNIVSPVYRIMGKYIAQPIHKLIVGDRDASPYKNNFYHRMVARREYFAETNNNQNPGHPIINSIKTKTDAIFKIKEGNEAVLRAGAADIREGIINEERQQILIQNLTKRMEKFDVQIQQLQQEIANKPYASNINDVKNALQHKINERNKINTQIQKNKCNEIGMTQSDAISDEQHSIASKEVNTIKTTVIKGVVKGLTAKYIGPKIENWLLERGKKIKEIEITQQVPETKQRWVDTTYKDEIVPIYENGLDTGKSINDIISDNAGKEITGFYSVYGGEKGAATYNLTGNENITAIFQADRLGGTGLSDKLGLKAPTFTNGTFSSELLNKNGLLNQDSTIGSLIEALNNGKIDINQIDDLYVSIGDKYWTKLSNLVGNMTTKIKVGEKVNKVVDVAGHYEDYTELVEKVIKTTEVVSDPTIKNIVNIGGKMGKISIITDGIFDVAENVRKTKTDVKSNKKKPRNYTFNEDADDIPKSKKEYRERD